MGCINTTSPTVRKQCKELIRQTQGSSPCVSQAKNRATNQLCGCGLLGVGIWLSVSQGSFATFSPSFPSLSAANMVIFVGAIVMVTGFLGCLGAIKENKCLLLSVHSKLVIKVKVSDMCRLDFHFSSPGKPCRD
uniref:Uncharacterized protein n=1 Tax=Knipowitschia caucasica TaxID=637954 RepID=A0AAV2L658_KNICA